MHSRRRPLEGSRFQRYADDPSPVPFAQLLGRRLVVREKLDGEDARIRFDGGELHVDGPAPLAAWASRRHDALRGGLGERWELHGVWLETKRVAFYDALPAWFVAVDIVDRECDAFVTQARRTELLDGLPLASVPTVHEGPVRSLKALHALVGPSRCKTQRWRESLRAAAKAAGLDVARVVLATDPLDDAVGLLVDVDGSSRPSGSESASLRLEFVRATFGSAVLDPHGDEPLAVANALAPGVAPEC